MSEATKPKFWGVALWVIFASLMAVAFAFDGTGNSGDSESHFLHSKFAFVHPWLFFDHWAKPLFVLLSSPFAQFGFVGMKVFNVLVAVLTGYVTLRLSHKMGMGWDMAALLLLFLIPTYTMLIFTGLTEPLFALVLSVGFLLAFEGKYWQAAVMVSFLPFVRSEGIVMAGVFAVYFVLKGRWKMLPLLAVGHVVYGIAGAPYHGTVFWPITRNPYANHEAYMSGGLFDFVGKLFYVCGISVFVMLCLGVLVWVSTFFLKRCKTVQSMEEHWLVYGCFGAYLAAHSVFWWLGLFHTMGLNRVLIGIAPSIALIAARGLWGVRQLVPNKKIAVAISSLLLIYGVVFPFTKNPAAPKFRDFKLHPDQEIVRDSVTPYLTERGLPVYFDTPYIAITTGIDFFDSAQRLGQTNQVFEANQPSFMVVWDSWFSVVEAGVQLEALTNRSELREVARFNNKEGNPRYVVFERTAIAE